MTDPLIVQLSKRQLDAYNRADLDAFASVYHRDVQVLDASGAIVRDGMDAFRAAYGEMFARHRDVTATVNERIVLGPHVIERESWSRVERATGEHTSGEVLVRYTEKDGLIRWAQFFRT